MRFIPGGQGERVRTDLSCTLFLAGHDDYDGGELVVEDTFGAPRIKLTVGDMVLYPGTRVHRIRPERAEMKRQWLLAFLALATSGAAPARHAEKCDPIPKDEWKPQAELDRKLKNEGWAIISRVKIENGFYEVYGKKAVGRKLEAFSHPKTLRS